jgi:D-xylose transport system substrate-binding protein
MLKRVILIATASLMALGLMVSCAPGKTKIGLSFSDFATERWSNEAKLMKTQLEGLGYEVLSQEANHDVKLQNDQIDNMVAQGVKAMIIVPEDGDAAATAVTKAAKAGVKVVAYDRLIKSADIAAYLSFDNMEVGRQQAAGVLKVVSKGNFVLLGGSPTDNNAVLFRAGQMEVLKPLIDKGQIKVVADQWVDNWDPANALKIMENILTKLKADKIKLDAVVASNDGTALGALQAMKAQGLAGKVPISGQDATADGCNSIVKGELTVTIFKDIRKLAPLAVSLADSLAQGKAVAEMKSFDLATLTNDKKYTGSVNCVFLPVVQVDKTNVDAEIVKSAFQKKEDVYRDIPADKIPQ